MLLVCDFAYRSVNGVSQDLEGSRSSRLPSQTLLTTSEIRPHKLPEQETIVDEGWCVSSGIRISWCESE